MREYLDLCDRIINEGVLIKNERTGVNCLTVINADITINVDKGEFPIITTRKSYYKSAIMEIIGYLRGYDKVSQFKGIGVNTWDLNADHNPIWNNNPNKKGEGDLGRVYGVQARHWTNQYKEQFDLLKSVYNDLKSGKDNRGEIITFWNPGEFNYGCLRPCLHSHQFSILDGTLYLNSTQRSQDILLGGNFNLIQCYVLLALMARITGLKPGKAYLKMVNVHMYENQIDLYKEVQSKRIPYKSPKLIIDERIKTLDDILTWVNGDCFNVEGYEYHAPIKYPFTV